MRTTIGKLMYKRQHSIREDARQIKAGFYQTKHRIKCVSESEEREAASLGMGVPRGNMLCYLNGTRDDSEEEPTSGDISGGTFSSFRTQTNRIQII